MYVFALTWDRCRGHAGFDPPAIHPKAVEQPVKLGRFFGTAGKHGFQGTARIMGVGGVNMGQGVQPDAGFAHTKA